MSPVVEDAPCRRPEPAVAEADGRGAVVEKALRRRRGCNGNARCACDVGHTRQQPCRLPMRLLFVARSVDAAAHPPMRSRGEKWPGGGIVVYTPRPRRRILSRERNEEEEGERRDGRGELAERQVVLCREIRSFEVTASFRITFFPAVPLACLPSHKPHSANQISPSPKGRGWEARVGPLGIVSSSHWPAASSCLGRERKLCK